jgi:chorismate synthase
MSFRYLTAGESHGKGLMGILEGIPSGLEITSEYIQEHLKRRKQGYGRGARQKIESDQVEILSGVRLGKTLGSPICLFIANQDFQAWQSIMRCEPSTEPVKREVDVPRPGHADLVGGIKYAHSDMRNVLERSSARETAIRVALGSVARRLLEDLGVRIGSRVVRIGSVQDTGIWEHPVSDLNGIADRSWVRCTHEETEKRMITEVDRAKKAGDTLGGEVEIYASGIPSGLGSYVQWDRRLEGKIAQALMSLNAIKGVEFGLGFEAAAKFGSEVHDEIFPGHQLDRVCFQTNRSGGIDGGMSTGQPVIVRAAMKPLATLMNPLQSVNLRTGQAALAHIERSDVCAVPAAAVICESILALVLAESVLEKFGGDSMSELGSRVKQWNHSCPIQTST